MHCRQLRVSAALLAVSQPHHVSPCDTPVGLTAAAMQTAAKKKKNAKVFFCFFVFFLMILPEVLGRWRRLLGSLRHLPAFLQD